MPETLLFKAVAIKNIVKMEKSNQETKQNVGMSKTQKASFCIFLHALPEY